MEIHSFTQSIIKKYHTRNPFEIIEAKNATLVYAPLIDVRGFYQYFQRNHIIYIDEGLLYKEKIFVAAHELGHMLLHRKSNAVYMDTRTFLNENKYEIEANQFAAELLIPDEVFLENCNYTTDQLARLLGYEQALIDMRLNLFEKTGGASC